MSKQRWKTALTGSLTLLGLVLILFLVLRDELPQMIGCIRSIDPAGFLLLLGAGCLYILLECGVSYYLLQSRLPSVTLRQAAAFTFLGFFGQVSTSAVGTIPLQSFYLYRCGLEPGSGAGLIILGYALQKAAVLVFAALSFLPQPALLRSAAGFPGYVMLGFLVNALIVLGLALLCTWGQAQRLSVFVLQKLPGTGKWAARKEAWLSNLTALFDTSRALLHDRPHRRRVLFLQLLKFFCFNSIPYLCLRLLHIEALPFFYALLLGSLTLLISHAIPNIAGMGPTEFAFMLLFSPQVGTAPASAALLLYRAASYFFPYLASIPVFLQVQKKVMDSL